MTAFPSMFYTINSSVSSLSGKMLVRASNGALKARQLYPSDKITWDLEFEMSASGRSTLDGHYNTDRDLAFDYTDPATTVTHSVQYAGPPQYEWQPGGWWKARVRLEKV